MVVCGLCSVIVVLFSVIWVFGKLSFVCRLFCYFWLVWFVVVWLVFDVFVVGVLRICFVVVIWMDCDGFWRVSLVVLNCLLCGNCDIRDIVVVWINGLVFFSSGSVWWIWVGVVLGFKRFSVDVWMIVGKLVCFVIVSKFLFVEFLDCLVWVNIVVKCVLW